MHISKIPILLQPRLQWSIYTF